MRSAIAAPHQPFFGLTIVSCEQGDIRQSPSGLLVHGQAGVRAIELSVQRNPRDRVLDEFHAGICDPAVALHDGRWGLATLELCLAAIESSRCGGELRLHEQVAAPRGLTRLDTPRAGP